LFIGTSAGASSSGSNNMYIGWGAGNGYKGTTNIKIITPGANQDVGIGNYNNIIGGNIQGDRNVVIGYFAGGNASFGSGNVIIGTQAGAMLNGAAQYNLLLGDGVSSAYDGGVGYVAGSGLKGSYNIDIAPQNAYSNITNGNAGSAENQTNYSLSYKLNIARTIRGDILSKQVSIGNASLSPTATLDIISNSSGRKGVIIQGAAAQTANYFEVQNSAGTPLLSISASGSISGAISPTIITATGGLTLTNVHHGYIIEQTGVVSSGTFTIGSTSEITIPGWNCMIVNIGSGVIVASGTSNIMRSPGYLNKSRTQFSSISIYRRATGDYVLGGDLA